MTVGEVALTLVLTVTYITLMIVVVIYNHLQKLIVGQTPRCSGVEPYRSRFESPENYAISRTNPILILRFLVRVVVFW